MASLGEFVLKKGKKMPSIELEGHSEAKFVLQDGKIVRVGEIAAPPDVSSPHDAPESPRPAYHS